MKPILHTTLIIILVIIILTLSMILLIKETQHINEINKYISDYNYQQERYLKNMGIFIKGYNELYEDYLELAAEKELCDDWELFTITGYSANDPLQGTNNIIATTFNLDYTRVQNLPIAASNCIPLYSVVEIEGLGGYIILDTGLGYRKDVGWEDDNWIDILFSTKEQALKFGKQKLFIKVLD